MAPYVRFNVRRSEPVFVPPVTPTPREIKRLSDLDNLESLQYMVPYIAFFSSNPNMAGIDPAIVVKQAVAKALVYYYPLAGRMRECPDLTPKLVLECTGEGAVFIEADADVTLSQLGNMLHPPYPYLHEILYEVPGLCDIFDCPILHIQVTRLKCGGFIMGMRFNNIMLDASGLIRFFTTVGELAGGATQPSVLPVWDRDRLFARRPPRETCDHAEFEEDGSEPEPKTDKVYRIFYFTKKEINTLRNLVPYNLRNSSSFELMTAFFWRCRTIALQLDPEETVRMIFALNARDRFDPPIPKGFYGYAIAFAGTMTTAGELCENFLGYAVELISKAKKKVTEEYMRSFVDGIALRGWPHIPAMMSSFFTTDLRWIEGLLDLDLGWGKPFSAGPGYAWYEPYPEAETGFIKCKNPKGEDITMVPICLPAAAMKIMEEEIYSTFKIRGITQASTYDHVIKSNL